MVVARVAPEPKPGADVGIAAGAIDVSGGVLCLLPTALPRHVAKANPPVRREAKRAQVPLAPFAPGVRQGEGRIVEHHHGVVGVIRRAHHAGL